MRLYFIAFTLYILHLSIEKNAFIFIKNVLFIIIYESQVAFMRYFYA